jgi:zinc protease
MASLMGRARLFGFAEALTGDASRHRLRPEVDNPINSKSIQELAQRWLSGDRVVLTYTPVAPPPPQSAAVLVTERPTPAEPTESRFPPVSTRLLPNGIRIVLVSEPDSELYWASAVVHSGSRTDPVGKEGLARLVARLAESPSVNDADALANARASVSGTVTPDATVVRLSGQGRSIESAARVWAKLIIQPELTAPSVATERSALVTEVEREAGTLYNTGSRVVPGVLTGRPLAVVSSGDVSSVLRIEAADVAAFHKLHFKPDNMTIVVSGGMTIGSLDRAMTALFGAWRPDRSARGSVDPPTPRPSTSVHILPRSGGEGAQVLVGYMVHGTSETFIASSRVLTEVLRERFVAATPDGAQTTNLWPYSIRGAQIYTLVGPVGPPNLVATLRRAVATVSDLEQNPPTAAEVAHIQKRLLYSFAPLYDSLPARHAGVVDGVILGLPGTHLRDYPALLRAMSADSVRAAARALTVSPRAIVVIGEVENLRQLLSGSEFHEVKTIDTSGRFLR